MTPDECAEWMAVYDLNFGLDADDKKDRQAALIAASAATAAGAKNCTIEKMMNYLRPKPQRSKSADEMFAWIRGEKQRLAPK